MAKEKKEKPVRLALSGLSLQAIQEQINAKYGANTLVIASQAAGLKMSYFSTGVVALDFAMGGGVPRGRISNFQGPYSALKTTVLLKTMANFQRGGKDRLAVLVDVEKSFDPAYASVVGVDNNRLAVVNPDYGEQAVDVLTDLLSTGQETLIGVDSIAAMTPAAEIEDGFDQQHMGLHARLVNKMIRVVTASMKRSLLDQDAPTITLIVLNQIREKVGIVYGSNETTPGGRGKDFAYSMSVKLHSSPGRALTENVEQNSIKRKLRFGQLVEFTVLKNKCGSTQFEDGEFTYYVRSKGDHAAYSFDNEESLLRYGRFHGVLQVKNGLFTSKVLPKMYKEAGLEAYLRVNPSAYEAVYKATLAASRLDNQLEYADPTEKPVIEIVRPQIKLGKRK